MADDVGVLRLAPAVPPVDLDPRADPVALPRRVLPADVVAGQPVDVDQLRIVAQLGFSGSGGFGIDPTSYSPLRDPARSRDIDMVGRGG